MRGYMGVSNEALVMAGVLRVYVEEGSFARDSSSATHI